MEIETIESFLQNLGLKKKLPEPELKNVLSKMNIHIGYRIKMTTKLKETRA